MDRSKLKRAAVELQQMIASMSRTQKLCRVARHLPCAQIIISDDGKTEKCTCTAWHHSPQRTTLTTVSTAPSAASASGTVEGATAPAPSMGASSVRLGTVGAMQKSAPPATFSTAPVSSSGGHALAVASASQQGEDRADPTRSLPPVCEKCHHRMLVHGDMQQISDLDLNRRVCPSAENGENGGSAENGDSAHAVQVATVVQMEQLMAEMRKQTNSAIQQQLAENFGVLKAELLNPTGKIPPVPGLVSGGKMGGGPLLSREELKKRQQSAIQAFRAYLARAPPFEKPVISEVLKNFVMHKYGKKVGEGRKRTVDKVYKHILTALQKMEIPDPKKRKVKNQNDHNIYQLNYKRWRIYCRGDGQEKGKPVHKFGEIFGRTMLLSIFEFLRTNISKLMHFSPEMDTYVSNFFRDFEPYVKDEYSLIFLENFPHHFEKLKNIEARIDHERSLKEQQAANPDAPSAPMPAPSTTESSSVVSDAMEVAEEVMDAPPSTMVSDMDASSSTFEGAVIGHVKGRDEMAKQEEQKGLLTSVVITNDGRRDSFIKLTILKEIFSQQLPKMPKDYITRLVFDSGNRNHKSVCLIKHGNVVGGICYRPYLTQGFIEIAFCAITADEQVKGYGTRLMNHLKRHMQIDGLHYFLTYADNFAIGYFKKQGFTRAVTLPREVWAGFIKDYDGGTLMQCQIHPKIDYLRSKEMIRRQREVVVSLVQKHSSSHIRRPGLECFEKGRSIPIAEIPGIAETRWAIDNPPQPTEAELQTLHAQFYDLLETLKNHKHGWPFTEPVDRDEVPDYFGVITDPIDLSLIESRLNRGDYYITKSIFFADLRRMIENCKTYNKEDTVFYKCAVNLQRVICDRGGAKFFK